MICKEDVVSWFKELESYKRIDVMCTLLDSCLPFELRFLGTCLEELGRRDSPELRGIELRVNNPQELASDIANCQLGEPTNLKIRRKLALYLALIRACSRSCVNELFKTLEGWGDRDFINFSDGNTLQELLLVYTMASRHPVFTFEQRMKCDEILSKIKECKVCSNSRSQQQSPQQNEQLPPTIHMTGGLHQQQQIPTPIQVIPQGTVPMGFQQSPLPQTMHSDVQHVPREIIFDAIPMFPAEFAANTIYAIRPYTQQQQQQQPPPPPLDPQQQQQHPPQSSSPMISQPSSPSHSRTTSPCRSTTNLIQQNQQQQQQLRNAQQRGVTLRNSRRPSVETTPPPSIQQQQHQQQSQQQHQQQFQHQQIIGLIGNDMISLQPNIKNVEEIYNADGTVALQLFRNGYSRTGHHTIPRQSKSTQLQHHNQPQQAQHHNQHIHNMTSNIISGPSPIPSGTNYGLNANLTYALQNMKIVDVLNPVENNIISNRHKSGGSDSSSIGSGGEMSPPETPALVVNNSSNLSINDQSNFSKHMTRINGRPDKLIPGVGGISSSGGGGGVTTTVLYTPSTNNPQLQFVGNDVMLPPLNLIPSPVGNNNNNSLSSTGNGSSSNNNLVTSTVMITTPSTLGGGGGGSGVSNVITTNPIILQQQQQQQFSATYPYHAQHLPTTRPPILSHNPTIAPLPATYRHPAFQIQPNGELVYPYAAQVAGPGTGFLPPSGAPPPAVVRSTGTVPTTVPPPTQQQQQQQQPPPPPTQQQPLPASALVAPAPYTALTVGTNKSISCFNCGSQSHTGRECQEASMEDVTRGSIYKLDYSSAVSPTTPSGHGSNINSSVGGNSVGSNIGTVTTAEIATETSSPTSSTSSLSNSTTK